MKAVLRKAVAANKTLAELKGTGELIPNQGVLINAIVLQEAKPTAEIQNKGPSCKCSRNEHIVRICRKKPDF